MGALEFRPPARAHGTDAPTAVQLADLVLAARRTVRGEFSGDETAHAALEQLIQVGTSAGGARAKAVVAFNPATYQVRSAYATPAEGFEQWLIKLSLTMLVSFACGFLVLGSADLFLGSTFQKAIQELDIDPEKVDPVRS